jgi:RNA ligase (TIGR02306 family)
MTVEHTERKLARVVKIDSLHEIKGADRIELAMIGGWQVVAQKGLYAAGDLAVYFEVDSLLPLDNPAFQFLSSSKNTVVDGVEYARIKTIKLRKQLSQGVLVPLTELGLKGFVFDDDLTKRLGILKYEKAAEKGMNGTPGVAGSKAFPSFIPKTDQTRLQNIPTQFEQARDKGELFEKSFKLDGSSLTAYSYKGVLGVASRNVGFNMQTVNKGFFTTLKEFVNMVKQRGFKRAKWEPQIKADKNAFTEMAQESGVLTALVRENRNLAFQGEMVGPSIQQNFEGVEKNELYIYDVYDIDARKYLLPAERQALCAKYGLKHVPLASPHPVVLPVDVATAILDADGPSGLQGKYREGFVYKSMDRDFSFKVISNAYLLKEE